MNADLIEEPGGPREWLIKKGGYFYRPNKSGYTAVKSEAGRYSEWDARREAEIEPWSMSAVHQDNAPEPLGDFNVAKIAALTDALAAKDTALSEMRAELDKRLEELGLVIMACPMSPETRTSPAHIGVRVLRDRLEAAEAAISEMRAERGAAPFKPVRKRATNPHEGG